MLLQRQKRELARFLDSLFGILRNQFARAALCAGAHCAHLYTMGQFILWFFIYFKFYKGFLLSIE
jgi:hypothetical protein